MSRPITTDLAVEQLYHDYHRPILRHLERLVEHHEVAEDLCQETFIKALQRWEQHDTSASPRAWLYRIATNTAYDYLRHKRRAGLAPLAEEPVWLEDASDVATHVSDSASIWAALNDLPDGYRRLLLYRGAGYEIKDIAAMLGSSVVATKARVHRARERFRQSYGA